MTVKKGNLYSSLAMRISNGKVLYDIETGSLVTHPSPYRIHYLQWERDGYKHKMGLHHNPTNARGIKFYPILKHVPE